MVAVEISKFLSLFLDYYGVPAHDSTMEILLQAVFSLVETFTEGKNLRRAVVRRKETKWS